MSRKKNNEPEKEISEQLATCNLEQPPKPPHEKRTEEEKRKQDPKSKSRLAGTPHTFYA